MYNEVLAAYLSENSLMKVSSQFAFQFGTGDFSVTLLFSPDTPGVLVSCLEEQAGTNLCKGWYLALHSDTTVVFQVCDGREVCSAVSSPIPDCFDGYLLHLAAVRSDGVLKLYLEGELIGRSPSAVSTRLDVSCNQSLVFGGDGPDRLGEEKYNGLLQCVTLWSRALPPSLFDFTASDVLPLDKDHLQGWWPLDGSLSDRGPYGFQITYCDNVSYYPVFDLSEIVKENGYCYGNVEQTVFALPVQTRSKHRLNETQEETLRRKITVSVDRQGIFLGSCAANAPILSYPKGVTLSVTSPSGRSITDMSTDDKQLIVLENGQVYQFLFLEPEQGDWTLELTAAPDSSFVLDYQFIPSGITREHLTQAMNSLYPQYIGSELADEVTPTSFLLSSLAKMITLDINQQLVQQSRRQADGKAALMVDPVTVGAVAILVGAAAIVGLGCYGLCKGIAALYRWIAGSTPNPTPEPEPEPELPYQYNWDTLSHELSNYYEYKISTFQIYDSIYKKLGKTVPQSPDKFYTRADFEALGEDMTLHIDIGGEGCFWDRDLLCGFADAININVVTENSQRNELAIPFLIHLDNWEMKWPFESGSVDRITSQGTPPYNDVELEEAARCIRKVKGARIDFWIPISAWQDFRLDNLAEKIRKLVEGTNIQVRVIQKANDPEFDGHYAKNFAKYSIELY